MEVKINCAKCGSENPHNYNFCNTCGHDLRKTKTSSSEFNYTEPHSYTPKYLADKILTTRSSIEGERKFVTVLFADVANFTSISERLDPEEVHQIMDGCLKILMDEIHKYEGTINQFTGDGVMALFGAPVACEDHAQRACYAAITIQNALDQYGKEMGLKFDIQFRMRVGMNSGLVVVGSIGDDLRMDYTAVGDTTNLAARMENAANPGSILISENTQKLVRDFFELEPLGEIKVKGKEKPQKTFQLLKTGDVETRIGASVAKGLTRFVGRKNSMSILMNVFAKIKSRSGQIVGIVGEAGVGKSRLLLEMRNMLPLDEFEYLEGRCLQYGGSILYLPILDILRSIFDINDDDKEFVVKRKINDVVSNLNGPFSSLNPSFQDILSLKVDDKDYIKLEPKEKREKIFEAIRDLLIRMSQDKSLVIAVEDLHWIDKTSEEFLNYFIDWLANTKILLILLYRPEYTHQWGSKSYYIKIGVDQLGMSSSGDLVKAILEEGEVAPELSQLILSRSAGNPLFMEEFTHTLVENGSIEKRDNQYALIGDPESIKVPDTIQGIIAARLDRLEDNLKRTIQVASVIGRDFAFKILQTITGMRTELKSYLLNLQGLEFIYEKNLFPELEYIFKHALTQEVAYSSLLQNRRKEIHEKIGMAIEEIYSERLEEFYEILSHHFLAAEAYKRAFRYLELSGTKCLYKFSLKGANGFYRKAYKIFNANEHNYTDLIRLLISWGRVLHLKGAYRELIKVFKFHEKTANTLSKNNEMLGLYFSWLGIALQCQEKLAESEKYLLMAKEIGEKIGDEELMGYAYAGLSYTYADAGKIDIAINYGKKATEICASNSADPELVHLAFTGLAYAYYFKGNAKETNRLAHLLLDYGTEKSNHRCKILGFMYSGAAKILIGDFKSALAIIKKGCNISSDPLLTNSAKFWLGFSYVLANEIPKAEPLLKEVLDFSEKNGTEYLKSSTIGFLGLIDMFNGSFNRGLKVIQNTQVILHDRDSKYRSAAIEFILGQIYSSFIKKDKNKSISFFMTIKNLSFLLKNIPSAFETAEKHLLLAVEISKQIGAEGITGQAHLELAQLYLSKTMIVKAKENATIALNIFKRNEAHLFREMTEQIIEEV